VFVPNTCVYLICFVLLCVLSLQHDKKKNHRCQAAGCAREFAQKGQLKSHVLAKHEGISQKEQAKRAKQAKQAKQAKWNRGKK
jgi:hypothetical protein